MNLTVDEMMRMKVVELRAELSARGLDNRGVKAVLIDRLSAALSAKDGGQSSNNPDKVKTSPKAASVVSSTASSSSEQKLQSPVRTKPPSSSSASSSHSTSFLPELQAICQELLDCNDKIAVYGLIYQERYNSFINENWPYTEPHQKYNPHNLAMSGFVFLLNEPIPTARCFVCFETIQCPDDDDGDPWVKHFTKSANCDYVKLGYRSIPDDCTISEALRLCEASWMNKFVRVISA